MKKSNLLLVAFMLFSVQIFAQNIYLVEECKVIDSDRCTMYLYDGDAYAEIKMAGDEVGCSGFSLCDEEAYVTFDLEGKYNALSFNIGHSHKCTERVGAVTIHGDGNKLFDEKVSGYEPPRQHIIDVLGVKELTFKIAAADINVVVLNALLWEPGQTPEPIVREVAPATAPVELVKELKPYFVSDCMAEITPDKSPILLNRLAYEYGLRGDMISSQAETESGFAYFNLRRDFSKLSFIVGCHDDVSGDSGSGWVTVKADGKIVEEIEIKEGAIAKQVILDIPDCEILSFHTEQIVGTSFAELACIVVYPEGYEVDIVLNEDGLAPADPRLKELPDVCKLISSIKPYQVMGKVKKQIYDGSSDHVTFSMGGTEFSEGIILYQTSSHLDDNLSACATFDMGNEFDYISFTAGYIGKNWSMNSDTLMVYADDELVFTTPLIPTCPNQSYVVPINKCRMLRICNAGCGNLDVATFGVADIVAYRGEAVENDLFAHTQPEFPQQIELIDLGKPYIHYAATTNEHKSDIFYDGSTKKQYYEINGKRIYKGFVLQTAPQFSLDFKALGAGKDSNSAATEATVEAPLAPIASFIKFATGGMAIENSLAAFNTYGEYSTVTFKVGALPNPSKKSDYHEHLIIGADQKIVASLGVYETMEPQEIRVPIDGCKQLMFWLSNTNGNSAKFVIYDIIVSKDQSTLNIPVPVRYSIPVMTEVKTATFDINNEYIRYPNSNKSEAVDNYLSGAHSFYKKVRNVADSYRSSYTIYTFYLESSSGPCKVVEIRSSKKQDLNYNVVTEYNNVKKQVEALAEMKAQKRILRRNRNAALAGLWSMGLDGFKYQKYVKVYRIALKECFDIVDKLYEEKRKELELLERILKKPLTIDNISSTEKSIICPVTKRETLPNFPLQHITYFDMKE